MCLYRIVTLLTCPGASQADPDDKEGNGCTMVAGTEVQSGDTYLREWEWVRYNWYAAVCIEFATGCPCHSHSHKQSMAQLAK